MEGMFLTALWFRGWAEFTVPSYVAEEWEKASV